VKKKISWFISLLWRTNFFFTSFFSSAMSYQRRTNVLPACNLRCTDDFIV